MGIPNHNPSRNSDFSVVSWRNWPRRLFTIMQHAVIKLYAVRISDICIKEDYKGLYVGYNRVLNPLVSRNISEINLMTHCIHCFTHRIYSLKFYLNFRWWMSFESFHMNLLEKIYMKLAWRLIFLASLQWLGYYDWYYIRTQTTHMFSICFIFKPDNPMWMVSDQW